MFVYKLSSPNRNHSSADIPVYDAQSMQILQCKNNLRSIELGTFFIETAQFVDVMQQLTSPSVIQYKIYWR